MVVSRHKCKQRMAPSEPCACLTEYRKTYTLKPAVITKSCKPEVGPVHTDAPCENLTTFRRDYNCQPLSKPYIRPQEPYLPPDATMDNLTSYRIEYTKKPTEPRKPTHRPQRHVTGQFSSDTTNRCDFQRWPVHPTRFHQADPYQPSADPFDADTSYRTTFRGHLQPVRPSCKPPTVPHQSAEPCDDRTTHRLSYVKHPLPCPEPKQPQVWQPNPACLDQLTNYRKDYTAKCCGKPKSCKPDNTPLQSDSPFCGATTNRCDYTVWPVPEVHVHQPDPYQPPDGAMTSLTTHRVEYTPKPINKLLPCKPKQRCKPAGHMEDLTTHRVDYQSWGPVERPAQVNRDQYEPVVEPFDGLATYTTSYVRHNEPPRPSCKPLEVAVQSDAPLQEQTEYRKEYTKKHLDQCVAGVLAAGGRCVGHVPRRECYDFVETDTQGHDWYQAAASTAPTTVMVS